MEIRLAERNEFEVFNEMYVNFFVDGEKGHRQAPVTPEAYDELLEYECIYFAVQDGNILGFATVYAFEDEGVQISLFYMKEKNKGYGVQFLKLMEKEVRDSGFKRIFVHVFDERPERFWQRQGYMSVNGTEEFEKIFK